MKIQDSVSRATPPVDNPAQASRAPRRPAGFLLAAVSLVGVLAAGLVWSLRGWPDALAVYLVTVLALGAALLWLSGREQAAGSAPGRATAGTPAPLSAGPDDSGLRRLGP